MLYSEKQIVIQYTWHENLGKLEVCMIGARMPRHAVGQLSKIDL